MFPYSVCVARQRIHTVSDVFGLFPDFFCEQVDRPRILRSVFRPRSTDKFRIQSLRWFDSEYRSHVSLLRLGNNFTFQFNVKVDCGP